jgi:Cu/Ag efflux protein CusF
MIRAIKVLSAFAVVLVLTNAGKLYAEETKGTIKSVDTGKNEVVLKGTIKNSIYELNKDTVVYLDGVQSKLADLREGDQAWIRYEKQGEHMVAGWIRGLRNAKEESGTVKDIFADKREITLKGLVKDTTYELDKSGTVWVNGKEAALRDIRAGDDVLITYQRKGDHNMAASVMVTRK